MDYLNLANNNLTKLFGDKHKIITLVDVEKVYKRKDLLSINVDAKTTKGLDKGYLTGILYLAPSTISGYNTCKAASSGCKTACLFSAGRGRFYSVYRARTIKTLAFLLNQNLFMQALIKSIIKLEAKAAKLGLTPCVRLNGTSDLDWSSINLKDDFEFINIFDYFSSFEGGLQFYDYTKHPDRLLKNHNKNYHLTFSTSEVNYKQSFELLRKGFNVAIVFDKVPTKYFGFCIEGHEVLDGDVTDLRFLDAKSETKGFIVGLKAKGRAKKDNTGFVVRGACENLTEKAG